jgi:HK97 family phage major capsid protein
MAENEQKVVEDVQKEIKALGDNVKGLFDSQAKEIKELQDTLSGFEGSLEGSVDPLVEAKVSKLTEAISLKQEALEKAMVERMDGLDVALQRLPKGVVEEGSKEEKEEAIQWKTSCLTTRFKGQIPESMQEGIKDTSVEEYRDYKTAFVKSMRYENPILTEGESKALLVGSDPDGGITVTPFMATAIRTRLFESDPIRALAASQTISTDAYEELVDINEGTSGGWVGEQTAPTETNTPQWNKKRIPVNEQFAEPRATQQLLEDSGIAIESWLSGKIADIITRTEAAAFVTGDGVGKPRGFLTITSGTSWNQIQQVNMGAASNLTTDGFIDVMYSLKEMHMFRGTWLMNRLAVRDTMKLKDGDGNYIWRGGLQAGQPGTILGAPVRMSTTVPVVATNSLSVVYANWREAYMIVDRLGITVMRDPFTAKPFVKFYTRKRVGGDVVNYDAIKIGKVAV